MNRLFEKWELYDHYDKLTKTKESVSVKNWVVGERSEKKLTNQHLVGLMHKKKDKMSRKIRCNSEYSRMPPRIPPTSSFAYAVAPTRSASKKNSKSLEKEYADMILGMSSKQSASPRTLELTRPRSSEAMSPRISSLPQLTQCSLAGAIQMQRVDSLSLPLPPRIRRHGEEKRASRHQKEREAQRLMIQDRIDEEKKKKKKGVNSELGSFFGSFDTDMMSSLSGGMSGFSFRSRSPSVTELLTKRPTRTGSLSLLLPPASSSPKSQSFRRKSSDSTHRKTQTGSTSDVMEKKQYVFQSSKKRLLSSSKPTPISSKDSATYDSTSKQLQFLTPPNARFSVDSLSSSSAQKGRYPDLPQYSHSIGRQPSLLSARLPPFRLNAEIGSDDQRCASLRLSFLSRSMCHVLDIAYRDSAMFQSTSGNPSKRQKVPSHRLPALDSLNVKLFVTPHIQKLKHGRLRSVAKDKRIAKCIPDVRVLNNGYLCLQSLIDVYKGTVGNAIYAQQQLAWEAKARDHELKRKKRSGSASFKPSDIHRYGMFSGEAEGLSSPTQQYCLCHDDNSDILSEYSVEEEERDVVAIKDLSQPMIHSDGDEDKNISSATPGYSNRKTRDPKIGSSVSIPQFKIDSEDDSKYGPKIDIQHDTDDVSEQGEEHLQGPMLADVLCTISESVSDDDFDGGANALSEPKDRIEKDGRGIWRTDSRLEFEKLIDVACDGSDLFESTNSLNSLTTSSLGSSSSSSLPELCSATSASKVDKFTPITSLRPIFSLSRTSHRETTDHYLGNVIGYVVKCIVTHKSRSEEASCIVFFGSGELLKAAEEYINIYDF
ncbi:hypothetical protein ADUPG1_012530 [Aduncisulcus paluster]|uniref:Uncharacterized protein n=1 Tax=Aduncisulcus paluster TaxID=2918883 RepID=A0ABQ5JZR4_9EUKA|nr:hypothetical protein ADUPG1_012530 [Aduncisulcus paluster]